MRGTHAAPPPARGLPVRLACAVGALLDDYRELDVVVDAVPLGAHRARVRPRHHAVAKLAGPQHALLLEGPLADDGAEGLVGGAAQAAI